MDVEGGRCCLPERKQPRDGPTGAGLGLQARGEDWRVRIGQSGSQAIKRLVGRMLAARPPLPPDRPCQMACLPEAAGARER